MVAMMLANMASAAKRDAVRYIKNLPNQLSDRYNVVCLKIVRAAAMCTGVGVTLLDYIRPTRQQRGHSDQASKSLNAGTTIEASTGGAAELAASGSEGTDSLACFTANLTTKRAVKPEMIGNIASVRTILVSPHVVTINGLSAMDAGGRGATLFRFPVTVLRAIRSIFRCQRVGTEGLAANDALSLRHHALRRVITRWGTVLLGIVRSDSKSCFAAEAKAGDKIKGHRVTSGVMRLGVISVGAALILLHYSPAVADHNVYLPYAGETWMAQEIKRDQEQVWCVDARASAYPNFVTQLRDVNGQFEARVGIRHRQVDYADPACEIKHTMPDGITCDGWAGRIYYANRPVVVEYCWPLGYTDFRTVHGHELGHGILGQLHEQYKDSGGSIQCTGRQDTVMDCGSGVRYPTTGLDVPRGCAIILTNWCGQAPSVTWPQWTGTRWLFEDGWSFAPNASCGEFYSPDNRLVWGACDSSWDARWNAIMNCWVGRDSLYCSGLWFAGGLKLP